MKSLAEYKATTPAAELYHFLAETVLAKRITTFAGLIEFIKDLPRDERRAAVCRRLFILIRRLYWGFFADVSPEAYPKIWKAIVLEHHEFPGCGDLKRNLNISDVFVGILDLHGYTRFCEKNKHNLSMLQMLDDMIQNDVVGIAREHDVVLQRRQGDEMVLVGASAADMVRVTLLILGHFSKRRQIDIKTKTTHRSGYKIILDDMRISAGIAGGKKFTPFIITRDGDLSGGVVNTAARLQSRANELSGDQSRIIVSRSVAVSYESEIRQNPAAVLPVEFFDSGWISFKGISVAVSEVLFEEGQRYRTAYAADLEEFFKAIDANNWKDGLFNSLLTLLTRVYEKMPPFRIAAVSNDVPTELGNAELISLCRTALGRFRQQQLYREAIAGLADIIEITRRIHGFDKLVLEYGDQIYRRYRELGEAFAARYEAKIDERAPVTLPAKYRHIYAESQKALGIRARLREQVEAGLTPLDISLLWSGAVDGSLESQTVTIHSGKR